MSRVYNTNCCGVKEIHGIQDERPDQSVRVAGEFIKGGGRMGMFIFTCNDVSKGKGKGTGDVLMQYILDNKLGTVTQTKSVKNRNTSRIICLYAWEYDYDALLKFTDVLIVEEKKRREDMLLKIEEYKKKMPIGTIVSVNPEHKSKVYSGNYFRSKATIESFDKYPNCLILRMTSGVTWNFYLSEMCYLQIEKKADAKKPTKRAKVVTKANTLAYDLF